MSYKHGPKPVIGLIGAIGGGKSTAGRLLAARGGHVIDADALGHDALRQPEIVAALVNRWGDRVRSPDGTLDRREIARVVFANAAERNALEQTVFPYIGGRAKQAIDAAQADPTVAFVVLDAAVLLEAGWGDTVDRLLYVDAPRDQRVKRLASRSGWSESELVAREAAQWPAGRKTALADAVLVNDADDRAFAAALDRTLAGWGIARM